jgi:hypothetical protein
LLYLTSPNLRGEDVERVQVRLRDHGYAPGPLDAAYGPTTAAAVRKFQRDAGLEVDGIVGPQTLRRLNADAKPSPPPALPGREPPGEGALRWMIKGDGMTESPPGSNRCATTREFGLIGPWCMMDVSLAFKHGAGLILGDDPQPDPWGYWQGRGFAYVPAFEAWARSRGFYVGRRATPQRCDVVTFQFDRDPEADHVAIVERYLGGGQFLTREGNTGVGDDANGGRRMQRRRYVSQLAGVYRITRTRP